MYLDTLARYKPRVLLEMNHRCLNAFHRITLPEFRDELLKLFPFVYAVQLPTNRTFGAKQISTPFTVAILCRCSS